MAQLYVKISYPSLQATPAGQCAEHRERWFRPAGTVESLAFSWALWLAPFFLAATAAQAQQTIADAICILNTK